MNPQIEGDSDAGSASDEEDDDDEDVIDVKTDEVKDDNDDDDDDEACGLVTRPAVADPPATAAVGRAGDVQPMGAQTPLESENNAEARATDRWPLAKLLRLGGKPEFHPPSLRGV